jgi:hypothetical protein
MDGYNELKQSVILEGTVSKQVPVLSGVSQGTVLGPLLFLAYINDMPETATSSEIKLFASLLYHTINNQTDNDFFQRDLTILEDWENKWQMSFNAKKCIVIRITPKNKQVRQTSTIAVYASDFTGFVQSLRFRQINPSILFPLPKMFSRQNTRLCHKQQNTPKLLKNNIS